jgi:DNA-binding NtrC family response regulator
MFEYEANVVREISHLTNVAPSAAGTLCPTTARAKESVEMNNTHEKTLIYMARIPDEALVGHLKSQGWSISLAHSSSEAARIVKPDIPTAGLVDIGRFTVRDLAAFEPILRQQQIGWIALASPERLDEPDVRRLIRNYCFDYMKLPVAYPTVDYLLSHAFGMVTLCDLDMVAGVATAGDDEMVGTCDAMQQLFRMIRKVANTDAAVFISGESGTGKELTALAIHERSPRRKESFIAINCGAIPHHLLQSELFGYERGAFTGAHQRKIGRVEAAHGGTLFLDEIGDLPLESQASLLRFLQEGKIERLGGRDSISVDVRVISATHVDLEGAIREGRFRTDLFHRLCVLRIDEPPLRARGKDIEILAHHILHKFKTESSRKIRGFAPSAIEAMYSYKWPGNVREMINRVRRAIVMAESKLITADDLDLAQCIAQEAMTLAQARDTAEKRAIEAALLRHRHRLNEAANDLGISRVTLYRLMAAHGLRANAPQEQEKAEGSELPGLADRPGRPSDGNVCRE